MKLVSITFICLFSVLFLFADPQINVSCFPEALIHNNKPLDPGFLHQVFEGYEVTWPSESKENSPSDLRVEGNYVEYDWDYNCGSTSYTVYSSYSYLGSYDNKHILQLSYYDEGGSGRFYYLGILEKLATGELSAKYLAGGDRWNGVVVETPPPQLEENKLKYRRWLSPDWVLLNLIGYETEVSYPPNQGPFLEVLYEFDLVTEEDPKIIGLVIPSNFQHSLLSEWDFDNTQLEKTHLTISFNTVLQRFSKKESILLNLEEAKEFAHQIVCCLASSKEDFLNEVTAFRSSSMEDIQCNEI